MTLELFRIDDRLVHGQVVIGWGLPHALGFLVVVDDEIAAAPWEQELYRMGTPEGMEVRFATVAEAAAALPTYRADPRAGMLLTADIATMSRLVAAAPSVTAVTIGGLHHRADRAPRLRFVFLSSAEETALRALAAGGVAIVAQDVPTSAPIPLETVLAADGTA